MRSLGIHPHEGLMFSQEGPGQFLESKVYKQGSWSLPCFLVMGLFLCSLSLFQICGKGGEEKLHPDCVVCLWRPEEASGPLELKL